MISAPDLASALNAGCYCHTLNQPQLEQLLGKDASLRALAAQLKQSHPHLFSETVVFLSQTAYQHMLAAVQAIERTMALGTWQAHALAAAPAMAQHAWGPEGVLMGYDFHITPEGPRLIEINTNAGGALLNAALARAQNQCCQEMQLTIQHYGPLENLETELVDMFRSEWGLQRGTQALQTIAIVDDAPESQYLAPEFELFAALFAQHGLQAKVLDPSELEYRDGALQHQGQRIDLVYNRLTDFLLQAPEHQALARAYADGAVVLTPHPRAHALRANKMHLMHLADLALLQSLGVPEADQSVLQSVVPHSELVTPANTERLWAQRHQLFFKPLDGFGAKAVYRGDKITRKTWEHVSAGNYLAQAIVAPSTRAMQLNGATTELKFDVRAYTYQGRLLLLAARMYRGQTTNFRTEGGGFAPVVVVRDASCCS